MMGEPDFLFFLFFLKLERVGQEGMTASVMMRSFSPG
jgi:hypothetical protein